ncbi:unnamed protein product, partial [Brenthis ino]
MACCFNEIGEYAVTPILISPSEPDPCCFGTATYCPYLPRCSKKQTDCCETKPQSKYPRISTSTHNSCSEHFERLQSPTSPKYQTAHLPKEYCPTCKSPCKPVKTKYVIPCYRYEDGRIVGKLPVSAFKRNGMQDQEHSKLLGAANFLTRCPRDVSIECEIRPYGIKVNDPVKVPLYDNHGFNSCLLKKKPIDVALEDVNQPTTLMRRACEVAVGARPRRKPFVVSSFSADPDQEVHRYVSEDERVPYNNTLCGI